MPKTRVPLPAAVVRRDVNRTAQRRSRWQQQRGGDRIALGLATRTGVLAATTRAADA
jgi:hypothetical protein